MVGDPSAYLVGSVGVSACGADIGCAHVGVKRGVDGTAYGGALVGETEVFEQHGHR